MSIIEQRLAERAYIAASGTAVSLSGGINNEVLVRDSSVPGGLKWVNSGTIASGISNLVQGSIPFGGPTGTITEDNTKLFWDNSGKYLGVGTNTPQKSLHISDDSVTPALRFSSIVKGSGINTGEIEFYESSSNYWTIAKGSSTHLPVNNVLSFVYYNGALSTPVVTITKDGNVGIGEDEPSQALDLIGNIKLLNTDISASGVIYKGSNPFIHDFAVAATAGENTFIGINAGNFTMARDASYSDASNNTGIGYETLSSLTKGGQNTAVGVQALWSLTEGNNNTSVGVDAAMYTSDGSNNTAIGSQSMKWNSSGNENTAVGAGSLEEYYGDNNTALGTWALSFGTANNNTAVGHTALYGCSGSNNVSLGYQSGYSIETGSYNTFLGTDTGYSNDGSRNVFIGYQAGYNETGSNRLYISNSNTSTPLIYGNFSTPSLVFQGTVTCSGTQKVKTHSDYQGSEFTVQTAATQTTNATATTIHAIATSINTAYWMEANAIARESSGIEHAFFKRSAMVYRVAGAPTMSTVTASVSDYTTGASIWDLLLGIDGNNIVTQVVGSGTTTINWATTVNYQAIGSIS
jgi:hypothetical protein